MYTISIYKNIRMYYFPSITQYTKLTILFRVANQKTQTKQILHNCTWRCGALFDFCSYGGWLRNPAPVDRWFIPLFIGFQPSKVVQDLFHPQYE